jgi:alpha-L-fucosidase 2
MPIHPAMDLTIEGGPAACATISATLEHYFSLGQHQWAGHTYGQMASLGAVVGRGELAYDCLLKLTEYWLRPNGLHFNRDTRRTGNTLYQGDDLAFTLEANCGAAAGLGDMLLQGWGAAVRVFPALPEHWRDAAFRELLTEGAFRVSAVLREGRVRQVTVRATVARTLRLRDPFAGQAFEVRGPVTAREGDLLVVGLAAGEEVTLWLAGETLLETAEAATVARASDWSRLGLRG